MNKASIYNLLFIWNLFKILLMIIFPFFYKDLESYFCGEHYSQNPTGHDIFILVSGILWIYIMVSSWMKAAHYKIASNQAEIYSDGYIDTGFHSDWSIIGMIKATINFLKTDLWATDNRSGVEKLKDYRYTKAKTMSKKDASKLFAETSVLDSIDSQDNKLKDYVNTRIKYMSNEKALNWIKNDLKEPDKDK